MKTALLLRPGTGTSSSSGLCPGGWKEWQPHIAQRTAGAHLFRGPACNAVSEGSDGLVPQHSSLCSARKPSGPSGRALHFEMTQGGSLDSQQGEPVRTV